MTNGFIGEDENDSLEAWKQSDCLRVPQVTGKRLKLGLDGFFVGTKFGNPGCALGTDRPSLAGRTRSHNAEVQPCSLK